jgi:hypothetical protein
LLEQHCHNLLTSLLQTCCEKSCWRIVGTAFSQLVNKLATRLSRRHLVDKLMGQHCHNLLTNLLQTCCEKSCWRTVGTALSQLVNKLATRLLRRHLVDKLLEQHCHNLFTSLLQTCCEKPCWQVVGTALSHLLTSFLQACWGDILLTSCWNTNSIVTSFNKLATSLLRRHLFDKLLEQHCHIF